MATVTPTEAYARLDAIAQEIPAAVARKDARLAEALLLEKFDLVRSLVSSGLWVPRKRPDPPQTYDAYLRSPEWKEKRADALARALRRCQLCNAKAKKGAPLDVHHRTYERLGHEEPADLIVLCRDCHGRFHDKLPKAAA